MEEYQQRVLEEKAALDAKLVALQSFLNKNLSTVKPDEAARLQRQAYYMTEYSSVLAERIKAFT